MKKIQFRKKLMVMAISSLGMASAQSADFYFGQDDDIKLQINSQLSLGASWRTEDADPAYIGSGNDGVAGGKSTTTDDGNLNFAKNDSFSQIIKGSHDLQVTKDNFGAFARFKYWSDQELANGDQPHGNSANGYVADSPLSDEGFSDYAKFEGISLLDAYVYGSFEMGEMPLDVRIGRQVVSWGESTFIQGGMNSSNPFDVSALRRPGATLKEGILPVGMAYANLGVSETLSVEAFYQYEWSKTEVDGCGTLFAADFVADGCSGVTVGGSGGADDFTSTLGGYSMGRTVDNEAKDDGQYGIAARYYSEELNNTEFGVYYMNIHSRLPMIDGYRNSNAGDLGLPATVAGTAAPAPFVPSSHATLSANSVYNGFYQIAFPEDLQYFGMSFATNLGGVALSGEVSYKPDTPVQINGNHVLVAVLTEDVNATPVAQRVIDAGPGGYVTGWDAFDVTQVQITALQFIEQTLGASRITLIGEVGATMADGIEDSDFVYGRNPVFGLGQKGDDGYATDMSWGYRARAVFNYSNVFAGVSLKPTIAWSHDVEGYAPGPGGQFNEGSQSLGLSVEASYQQTYTATLGYKMFDGGDYNSASDKDFVSLSLAVTY